MTLRRLRWQCFISNKVFFKSSWVGKIPWRGKWQPSPAVLPGKFHGQRSLVGYSPWGLKELNMAQLLNHHHHHICLDNAIAHNRPEDHINIAFRPTGEQKNTCDLLYCDITFMVVAWKQTHSTSKVPVFGNVFNKFL